MKKHRSAILSISSGLLLAVSWPATGNLSPLLFIAFVPLMLAEQSFYKTKSSHFFKYAFLSFAIWNTFTTWWIYCVSEELATKLIAVLPPVFLNSILMASVFALFHFTKKYIGEKEGYISLPLYWLGFEYLHLNWELTWPWLTLGNGFANYVKWTQWYEYTGVLGGSAWILVANVLFFHLIKNGLSASAISKKKGLVVFLSIWTIVPAFVSWRIYDNYHETYNPVEVVIVQPNIDPYNEKFGGLSYEKQSNKFLLLADSLTTEKTQYVVGPETALTEDIWENNLKNSYGITSIQKFLQQYPSLTFVTGMASRKMYIQGETPSKTARQFYNGNEFYDSYNAALHVDNDVPFQIYHKSILVQGVEMMPFANILKPLEKLAIDLGGTVGSLGTQPEPSVFKSSYHSLKTATPICYESIYGEYVGKFVLKGASLLFIITNDGWWANTPGHKQHFSYARLRAIETRRSIARSANTGISGFINQKGDVLQTTGWWQPAVIKTSINANNKITIYTKYGDYIGSIAAFTGVFLLLFAWVKYLTRIMQLK